MEIETKLKPILEVADSPITLVPRRRDGRDLARKSVQSDRIRSAGSLDINSVDTAAIQNDAVDKDKLDYEQVDVTVTAGNPSGTGACTSGSVIIGIVPIGNQDQFVDNVSASGTTVTVTLAGNATANNQFRVTLLKA